jgi:hypothetical protein
MSITIKSAFEDTLRLINIDDIVSHRTNLSKIKQSHKYNQILSSIKEIGIVEPPAVIWNDAKEKFLILDGHLRIAALKEIGQQYALCLISTDDEAYTYNKYINRLSAIQSNKMILNAIANGVSEDKLAKALNISIISLRQKKGMLHGVCQDAVDLLKDKIISEKVFLILKKMKPARQIDVAMIMNDHRRYGYKFAEELLDATPDDMLISKRKIQKLSPSEIDKRLRLEQESIALNNDLRSIQDRYGINMIILSSIQSYLKRLLNNEKVVEFMQRNYPDILEKFIQICAIDFTRVENT